MSVDLAITGGVARLRLARPAARNALDRAMTARLAGVLRDLRARPDVRVVVTEGDERAYCAGSDLRELAACSPVEAGRMEADQAEMAALFDTLPQVSIARLEGYVLGGGLGLALYHDLRVAAEDAVLGLPEVALGWTPPWAAARLVDAVGAARAKWLLLTGERVSGQRAADWGLVHESVPRAGLAARVEALAGRLAAMDGAALAATRRLLVAASPFTARRWDDDANALFVECYGQPAARAAVQRFLGLPPS